MHVIVILERLQEFAYFNAFLLSEFYPLLCQVPVSLVTTVQPFWLSHCDTACVPDRSVTNRAPVLGNISITRTLIYLVSQIH
jgi:hypothetical protein